VNFNEGRWPLNSVSGRTLRSGAVRRRTMRPDVVDVMSLFDLFRPKWKNSKASVRRVAVRSIYPGL